MIPTTGHKPRRGGTELTPERTVAALSPAAASAKAGTRAVALAKAGHRLLSFDRRSISRLVINTSMNTCVHSERMFPTTCPHFDSESIKT